MSKKSAPFSKADLAEILKDPNDQLVCVDMDGVLCEGEFWNDGDDPAPREEMIAYLWKLYKRGAHLIIYSARQPRHYATTFAWLIKHQVPFHGIALLMKPGADLYIDDKGVHPEDLSVN